MSNEFKHNMHLKDYRKNWDTQELSIKDQKKFFL